MPEEPRIETREAVPYLALTREVTHGVSAVVDEAFPALFRRMSEQGATPAGPPLIRVLEVDGDGEPLELEVGSPVSDKDADDPGPTESRELPAGRYAVVEHVGPYRSDSERGMGAARADLIAWMESEGHRHGTETDRGMKLACAYDQMLVSPTDTDDHSQWRTEIAYLLED